MKTNKDQDQGPQQAPNSTLPQTYYSFSLISHTSNEIIIGWKAIAEAWGLVYPERHKGSEIKQIKRIMEKIVIPLHDDSGGIVSFRPIHKNGKFVFTDRNTICSLKKYYIFSRNDIAEHLGKSVIQLSRDMNRFPRLKKTIHNPDRKTVNRFTKGFVFADRLKLDHWRAMLEETRYKRKGKWEEHLKSLDTSHVYISDKRWKEIEGERPPKCPICKEPIQ